MGQFLLICACGGVGAVVRFVLNTSIQRSWRKLFPLSTFIINVLASLLAGVAAAAYTYQTVNYYTYLLFVTGFLGGFSTFSTAVNEMVSLAKSKKLVMAAFYFLVTLVIPFGMVIVGWWIGSMGR
ncbi:fluoride efflux transporter FluC [Bifidobacterium pseudolongum]|uniref:Fluoride-specific ion channel FluC n=1 Tax=Bifidobacterium pseudolongum subsp. globosum TaxID=1690 RepID=A0A2N3R6D7_9BIFI|nr:CrcB family protein [Bifidobacterium pseudolongum]PKV04922.1 camphor resistance protein CrcB [Bifidobacterium pseudolongum subsp. globosum]